MALQNISGSATIEGMELAKGKDRIRQLCDALQKETLDPAKEEARKILAQAEEEAQRRLAHADKEAETRLASARKEIEKERSILRAALQQAGKQAVTALKEEIERELFQKTLQQWVEQETVSPPLVAKLIDALVEAIGREGSSVDLSALIPQTLSKEEVNRLLARKSLERLREKSVELGAFTGGVQIKLHDQHVVLDISAEALVELLSRYLRKDFCTLLFAQ